MKAFGHNSPSELLQDAPAGAKVFSQGREPLEVVPHRPASPSGAAGAPEQIRRSIAPLGLMCLGGIRTRGSRPWLHTCAPSGHKGR